MLTLFLSLAPIAIVAFYVYFRDKYEKEPVLLLLKSMLAGGIIIIPVLAVEAGLGSYWAAKMGGEASQLSTAAYTGFVVAGLTEEVFKFIALYILVWKNPNFNERFDGIVYAVFVSLGFAAIENIAYVYSGGTGVGIARMFTSVPAHALFGVTMGFYLGLAKCFPQDKEKLLVLSLVWPIILHGAYDFIIMSGNAFLLLSFLPFVVYLWRSGFAHMRLMSQSSRFSPNPQEFYVPDNLE